MNMRSRLVTVLSPASPHNERMGFMLVTNIRRPDLFLGKP